MNSSRFGLHKQDLIDVLEKHVFNSGGLVIATDTTQAQTANDVYYFIGGKLYKLAATDGLGEPDGTITDGYYNVFVQAVDSDGNVSIEMGTEAEALADVIFPVTPADEAVIGFIIVYTDGSNFVGGTTALTGGDVTVVYVNATAPMRFSVPEASSAIDSD